MNFLSTITGSFSTPAGGNPTVVMIEAAYRSAGLQARYVNCEVGPADLGDAVRGARAMGWVGFNCSLPHKVSVIAHLDDVAPSASIIGAVNCVVHRDGRLIGENTDGQGFVASLRSIVDPTGTNVAILGAGGAARAIAVEVALAGAAAITIVNRNADRGQELTRLIDERTPSTASFVPWDGPHSVADSTDIVVNATSVGLAPDVHARVDLDLDTLREQIVVADVIPNPPNTRLLQDATARGCRTLDGLGMLVNQGVLGIKLWTGVDADATVMYEAVQRALDA
jgi:shikimate dehydrogenase